ncbi:activating transcription factor 3 isoform X2 [Rhodnius prolixus]
MVETLLELRSLARDAKEATAFQSFGLRNSVDNMYSMNSSLLTVPGTGAESTSTGVTPRTPEILNSLMAMTNPFEMTRGYPRVASSPPSDTTSSSSSPPSVQATRSQLIKEGLKLTLQTKRRAHSSGGSSPPTEGLGALSTQPKSEDIGLDSGQGENSGDGLTPEDEERRRRRRERNKIAATKCRLKKRERTVNLVQESEILETQNHDLKSQIKELENQRRKLVDMLSGHRPSCSKNYQTSAASTSSYQEPYQRCSNTMLESTSYTTYSAGPSTSYHKVSCESSTLAYHRNSGTSSGGAAAIYESGSYQRTATYVGGANTSYEKAVNRESAVMSSYPAHTDGVGGGYIRNSGSDSTVYTTLSSGSCSTSSGNVNNNGSPIMFIGSPPTPQYNRPSSLGLNTASSSDYESNTEIVDSPSIPPNNYHHFDEETGAYTAGFPTSSCIS